MRADKCHLGEIWHWNYAKNVNFDKICHRKFEKIFLWRSTVRFVKTEWKWKWRSANSKRNTFKAKKMLRRCSTCHENSKSIWCRTWKRQKNSFHCSFRLWLRGMFKENVHEVETTPHSNKLNRYKLMPNAYACFSNSICVRMRFATGPQCVNLNLALYDYIV